MMNKVLMGAVALGFAASATAQMQPPTVQTPRMMPPSQLPSKGERIQTRDQLVAKVRDHFAMMDTNRDGFIGGDEMQAVGGQHMQKMGGMGGHRMSMNDETTRDGPMGNPNAVFDRLDANHDGAISRDEFAKGREMRIERQVVINGAPGAPGGEMDGDHRGMMKMHGMAGAMGGHMMKMADLNKDGRVSLQEMTAAALQHFDRVDSNHDGRITPDERKAMHQQMMQEHGRNAG